ncbi:MAG TPA: response regulator [Planctomycetota bacterium]|nr:response regulator [Planctomycetota bacterium]
MPKRVLIVDDERGIAQALCVRLRAGGYDVRSAFDGATGLSLALEWRPDLIVLDIRMPEMDGFEVSRRLAACAELLATPVIFLSANVQESARQAAMAAGAHAFLTKPYESKDVLAAIASALDRTNTPTA